MAEIGNLIMNITEGASAAHAYIVEGGAGEARDAFVLELVKGLSCQAENPADRPCAKCPACRQIAAGTSMDVFHMDKTSPSKNYSTRDAEELIEKLSMGAYGRYKIAVIDDSDELSEIIQNKLLKTLEEPEEGSIIILATSNRDNLLQTVRSRCSIIRMSDYVTDEEAAEKSETIAKAAEVLAGGSEYFCEFRDTVEKKIKSREEALQMLGLAEDICREQMMNGDNPGEMVRRIELMEIAGMDIHRQMDYKKALKRLFLEI